MIQRIQSLYLLASILVCVIVFFIPLGYVMSDEVIEFTTRGFFVMETGELKSFNWLLSFPLTITVVLQLAAIFTFKNRGRQAMWVQVSLIMLLVFVFLSLLYADIFGLGVLSLDEEAEISYNFNIVLMAIAWILTYLALRAIKKDEALVRSADRMR